MKKIRESKRFVIGWGKKDGRLCFFVSHKDINRPQDPRPIDPKDLVQYLKEAVEYIENSKRSIGFLQKWKIKR